jgi:hypothetical protein
MIFLVFYFIVIIAMKIFLIFLSRVENDKYFIKLNDGLLDQEIRILRFFNEFSQKLFGIKKF